MTMWINSVDSSRSDSLGRSSVLITMTKLLLLQTRWRRKVFRCQAKKLFFKQTYQKEKYYSININTRLFFSFAYFLVPL